MIYFLFRGNIFEFLFYLHFYFFIIIIIFCLFQDLELEDILKIYLDGILDFNFNQLKGVYRILNKKEIGL